MKKLVKVHMLPSKSQIFQLDTGDMFISDSREHSWGKLEYLFCERVTSHGHAWNGSGISSYINYLYFTSDEEIKEGDWFIRNVGSILAVEQYIKDDHLYANDRKIVATTDKALCYIKQNGHLGQAIIPLPQISQQFQEEYCKAGGIDEVLVEYTKGICTHNSCYTPKCDDICYSIKTDSNNCVITHPVKPKLYTLEEVKIIAKNAFMEGGKSGYNSSKGLDFQTSDNWIKENL